MFERYRPVNARLFQQFYTWNFTGGTSDFVEFTFINFIDIYYFRAQCPGSESVNVIFQVPNIIASQNQQSAVSFTYNTQGPLLSNAQSVYINPPITTRQIRIKRASGGGTSIGYGFMILCELTENRQ